MARRSTLWPAMLASLADGHGFPREGFHSPGARMLSSAQGVSTISSADISIGRRVNFFRQAQRLPQTAVAGLVGVSVAELSGLEREVRTPSHTLLCRLASVLD